MIRRIVTRRTLKWAGTSACALLLVIALLSLRWGLSIVDERNLSCGISMASVFKGWQIPPTQPVPWLLVSTHNYSNWREFKQHWGTSAIWPRSLNYFGSDFVSVPLWIPIALAAALTALLWYLDRHRALPGHCRKCDYDLTGNASGVCPECGTPTGG